MRLLRFIFTRVFWIQLGLALVLGLIGFLSLNVGLRAYTRHSERISVPAVTGLDMQEAMTMLEASGLQPVIMDSLYSATGKAGSVVEQDPLSGVEVKGTRNVYLTVFRSTPPSEPLEVEEGMDAGVARIILDVKGFPFSERYEPNAELSGLVLRVEDARGRTRNPGDRLRKGESLVLVIGQSSTAEVPLPDLVGMTRVAALKVLRQGGLMIGYADWTFSAETAEDSVTAVISAQQPGYFPGRMVPEGSAIDLTISAPEVGPEPQ